MRVTLTCSKIALTLALAACAGAARAHPHVYVEARTAFVVEAGQLVAIRHDWIFDEGFSAFASQGLDSNNDGQLSREELQPLAQVNVESLLDYGYFSYPLIDGRKVGFKLPTDYYLSFDKGELTLHFTLPLREPVEAKGRKIDLDVYDPGYFVDFELMKESPVSVTSPACKTSFKRKPAPDDATAAILGSIPATERELPRNLRQLTEAFANRLHLECAG